MTNAIFLQRLLRDLSALQTDPVPGVFTSTDYSNNLQQVRPP
jgi:hypothetical protein